MRKIVFLFSFFLLVKFSFSQELPSQAPMNPEFLDYISNIRNGKVSTDSHAHHLGRIPLPVKPDFSNYKPGSEVKNKSFDPSYDLRDEGGLTSVKNQGNCGSCWTFATMANIESVWKIDGYGTYDLSEQNLHTCNNDFEFGHCNGGNFYMSTAYMAKGIGPVTEADDPYQADSDSSCSSGLTPVRYVTEAIFIPTNETDIKQAILDHGALYTSMYWLSSAYNSGDYTYYYDGPGDGSDGGGGHAVTIVGWDDNKSTASSNDGAWIIKNSWGSYWGESGYFYLSYDDVEANDFVACFTQSIDYDSQRHIFGYDDYGWVSSYGYSDGGTDYGLVKFTADDNYTVSKIGTYAVGAGVNLTVTVYDDYSSGSLSNQLATASKSCTKPGYYTLDLSSSFNISSGDDFYVKVKYENGGSHPVPVETNYSGYLTNATIESGKYWLSTSGGDGSWTAVGTGTSYEVDMCIKAYSITGTGTPSSNKFTGADEVQIYPNPANDQVAIECDKSIKNITLLNLQGQIITVKEVRSAEAIVNTDQYAEGIYILKIETVDNQTINKRLVIKRD